LNWTTTSALAREGTATLKAIANPNIASRVRFITAPPSMQIQTLAGWESCGSAKAFRVTDIDPHRCRLLLNTKTKKERLSPP
jgi:hypothetical protein